MKIVKVKFNGKILEIPVEDNIKTIKFPDSKGGCVVITLGD